MERNSIWVDARMRYIRGLILFVATLHTFIAIGLSRLIYCELELWRLGSAIATVYSAAECIYMVFCVQYITSLESFLTTNNSFDNQDSRSNVKRYCYVTLVLLWFVFHFCVIIISMFIVGQAYEHLQSYIYAIIFVHFIVHCYMTYVSLNRVWETGKFVPYQIVLNRKIYHHDY